MTINKQVSLNNSVVSSEKLAHKQIETERMQDVSLLLQNLFESDEATIKLIIDCLYDVGSINLINQKFRCRPLNRVFKVIARMSKPVFRVYAWHWFKKNCPQLITNWLKFKLAFEYPITKPQEIALEVSAIPQHQPLPADNLSRELKSLRYQVRWLSGIVIISLSALGIVVTTLNRNPKGLLQSRQQLQSTICR